MDFKTVLTTCPYCAVGCNMPLQVMDGEIVGTLPAKTGPSNEGRLCIKGWTVRRGVIKAKALVTERVRPGVVFIPLHYVENAANRLTNAALDPATKTPEYKAGAVSLKKVA
jgi:predicted molibdopterin-dependent oxidoreductase YjgC